MVGYDACSNRPLSNPVLLKLINVYSLFRNMEVLHFMENEIERFQIVRIEVKLFVV
jgi:hypothetical protein